MVICKSTTHAYYPVLSRVPGSIRGTGRIRYVRGFLPVRPKSSFSLAGRGGGCVKMGLDAEREQLTCPRRIFFLFWYVFSSSCASRNLPATNICRYRLLLLRDPWLGRFSIDSVRRTQAYPVKEDFSEDRFCATA